jgi:hypothetical protein
MPSLCHAHPPTLCMHTPTLCMHTPTLCTHTHVLYPHIRIVYTHTHTRFVPTHPYCVHTHTHLLYPHIRVVYTHMHTFTQNAHVCAHPRRRRYIEYETALEHLRQLRRKERGIEGKRSLADYCLVRRIHFIYQRALSKFRCGGRVGRHAVPTPCPRTFSACRRACGRVKRRVAPDPSHPIPLPLSTPFPSTPPTRCRRGDLGLWARWLAFCQSSRSSRQMSKVLARALQLHPTSPALWTRAAAWEFEHNSNAGAARSLMQRGLRMCKESPGLWHEYFRMELLYALRLRARREVLGIAANGAGEAVGGGGSAGPGPGPESAPGEGEGEGEGGAAGEGSAVLRGAVAGVVFRGAIAAAPESLPFRARFLDILRPFEFEGKRELEVSSCAWMEGGSAWRVHGFMGSCAWVYGFLRMGLWVPAHGFMGSCACLWALFQCRYPNHACCATRCLSPRPPSITPNFIHAHPPLPARRVSSWAAWPGTSAQPLSTGTWLLATTSSPSHPTSMPTPMLLSQRSRRRWGRTMRGCAAWRRPDGPPSTMLSWRSCRSRWRAWLGRAAAAAAAGRSEVAPLEVCVRRRWGQRRGWGG